MQDPSMSHVTRSAVDPSNIRALRLGHGANCSSIGSVVDTLFVTSLLGGAIFAAVVAALGKEPVEVIGDGAKSKESSPAPHDAETHEGSEP
jgi:hypothetical protein